jgi:hypothetical protein
LTIINLTCIISEDSTHNVYYQAYANKNRHHWKNDGGTGCDGTDHPGDEPAQSCIASLPDFHWALLGTMFSISMFGMVIGEAGCGWLADRKGIRLSIITGTFFTGLFFFSFLFLLTWHR